MFRLKICGVTNVADALAAADAGADAVGLNFYRGSSRCVSVAAAKAIAEAVSQEIDCVGVFVNSAAEEIRATCQEARIHLIQLHGDEPPEFLAALNQDFRIIRARRLDEHGTRAIIEDIEACRRLSGSAPDAILIDAAVAGSFGGTGQALNWSELSDLAELRKRCPLILAGGLTPENVAEAIRIVRPHGVDVASGVEASPGKKDHQKIRDFIAAARESLASI